MLSVVQSTNFYIEPALEKKVCGPSVNFQKPDQSKPQWYLNNGFQDYRYIFISFSQYNFNLNQSFQSMQTQPFQQRFTIHTFQIITCRLSGFSGFGNSNFLLNVLFTPTGLLNLIFSISIELCYNPDQADLCAF